MAAYCGKCKVDWERYQARQGCPACGGAVRAGAGASLQGSIDVDLMPEGQRRQLSAYLAGKLGSVEVRLRTPGGGDAGRSHRPFANHSEDVLRRVMDQLVDGFVKISSPERMSPETAARRRSSAHSAPGHKSSGK
jgi:hypothetical protein